MHLSYMYMYMYIYIYLVTLIFFATFPLLWAKIVSAYMTFLDLWFLVPGLFGEVLLPTIAGPTLFAVLRELETEHGGGRTVGF